jgi:hypothetical protein
MACTVTPSCGELATGLRRRSTDSFRCPQPRPQPVVGFHEHQGIMVLIGTPDQPSVDSEPPEVIEQPGIVNYQR